jgi:hypothetical protein
VWTLPGVRDAWATAGRNVMTEKNREANATLVIVFVFIV